MRGQSVEPYAQCALGHSFQQGSAVRQTVLIYGLNSQGKGHQNMHAHSSINSDGELCQKWPVFYLLGSQQRRRQSNFTVR